MTDTTPSTSEQSELCPWCAFWMDEAAKSHQLGAIMAGLLTEPQREELERLRREMKQHSLGDRPSSIAADKLRRLIELEALDSRAAVAPVDVEESITERLAEIEGACNDALLDVYDLSIANASLSPSYARETADCIGNKVGKIRKAVAAIRAATPETNSDGVARAAAGEIVGTVFDNTAASPETLKRVMIERITRHLGSAAVPEQGFVPEPPVTVDGACFLCEKGFPIKDGIHYGSQSLGMIPSRLCATTPPVTENKE